MYNIPDDIRQFIFESVDSVAQLDVLFFLRANAGQHYNATLIAKELRTSLDSATQNLLSLKSLGLLNEDEDQPGFYIYQPNHPELAGLITRFEEVYKVRQHKVLELIFSTSKRARLFADAFTISKNSSSDGDDHG